MSNNKRLLISKLERKLTINFVQGILLIKAPHENALILDVEGSDSVAKWGDKYIYKKIHF